MVARSFPARLSAGVLSGVLLGLAFPNVSAVFLLPVALVPLLWAVDGAGPRAAFVTGWAFGAAFWLTTIPWIAYTIHRYGDFSGPAAAFGLVVAAALLGVPFGVVTSLVAAAAPRGPAAFLATWAGAWVVQEGIRTYALSGFPWALLSYPLAAFPLLAQTASLGGAWLTSALVVLVNAGIYLALRGRSGDRTAGATAVAAAAALSLTWGAWRLGTPSRPGNGTPLRVVLLQPGTPQEVRQSFEAAAAIRRDVLAQTRLLVPPGSADLVVWPESATLDAWPWDAGYRLDLTELCRELGTALLLNTVWSDAPEDPSAPYYNSALLVTANGPVLPPYHKLRLVPFGEYVPLAKLLRSIGPVSRAVPGSFTPGERPVEIPLRGHLLGGAVCYEVVYPWILRAHVRAGADVLFTITNDAWYGAAGAQPQHFEAAVFRAIETGRPLLRAAVTGISGWIDDRGRVLASLGPGRRGAIEGTLRPPDPSELTPAVRLGDGLLWVCAAGLAAAILRRRLPSGRAGAEGASPADGRETGT